MWPTLLVLVKFPYARGTCSICRAVHVAQSKYERALMVSVPRRSWHQPLRGLLDVTANDGG